jgi:hypothetical protein
MTTMPSSRDSATDRPSEAQPTPPVTPGARVEVWNAFLSSWTTGFVLIEPLEDGCWLERQSDNAVLPVPVDASRLRPAS